MELVRPVAETEHAVHYKLTPALIHRIFVKYPAVQKAYEAYVPHKMSEHNFWRKYFKSKHASKKAKLTADDVFSHPVEFGRLFLLC